MWKGMKERGKSPTECNTKQNLHAEVPSEFWFVCLCASVFARTYVQIKYFLKRIPLLKENLKCTKKDSYGTRPLEFLVTMVVKKYSRFEVTATSSKNKLTQSYFSNKIRKSCVCVAECESVCVNACPWGVLIWVWEVYGRFIYFCIVHFLYFCGCMPTSWGVQRPPILHFV